MGVNQRGYCFFSFSPHPKDKEMAVNNMQYIVQLLIVNFNTFDLLKLFAHTSSTQNKAQSAKAC